MAAEQKKTQSCDCNYLVGLDSEVKTNIGRFFLFVSHNAFALVCAHASSRALQDWDNNILDLPTKICYEELQDDGTWKLHELSTARYREVRSDKAKWRAPGGNPVNAYAQFGDTGPRGDNAFVDDVAAALDAVLERNGADFELRCCLLLSQMRVFL